MIRDHTEVMWCANCEEYVQITALVKTMHIDDFMEIRNGEQEMITEEEASAFFANNSADYRVCPECGHMDSGMTLARTVYECSTCEADYLTFAEAHQCCG